MESGWKYVRRQFLLVAFIIFLGLIFLGLGLVLGYALIGDGENPLSILSPQKWHSLISKMTGQ